MNVIRRFVLVACLCAVGCSPKGGVLKSEATVQPKPSVQKRKSPKAARCEGRMSAELESGDFADVHRTFHSDACRGYGMPTDKMRALYAEMSERKTRQRDERERLADEERAAEADARCREGLSAYREKERSRRTERARLGALTRGRRSAQTIAASASMFAVRSEAEKIENHAREKGFSCEADQIHRLQREASLLQQAGSGDLLNKYENCRKTLARGKHVRAAFCQANREATRLSGAETESRLKAAGFRTTASVSGQCGSILRITSRDFADQAEMRSLGLGSSGDLWVKKVVITNGRVSVVHEFDHLLPLSKAAKNWFDGAFPSFLQPTYRPPTRRGMTVEEIRASAIMANPAAHEPSRFPRYLTNCLMKLAIEDIRACGATESLSVTLSVAPNGSPEQIRSVGGGLAADDQCVQDAVERIPFPSHGEDSFPISHEYVL